MNGAYFGTRSLKSSILIRPAGVLPTVMSKKTIGRGPEGTGVDMLCWRVVMKRKGAAVRGRVLVMLVRALAEVKRGRTERTRVDLRPFAEIIKQPTHQQ